MTGAVTLNGVTETFRGSVYMRYVNEVDACS